MNQSIEDIPAAQCARSAHGEEQSSGQPDDGSPNFDELLGGTLPHESYSDGDAAFSEVARSQLALADVAVLAFGGSLVDEGWLALQDNAMVGGDVDSSHASDPLSPSMLAEIWEDEQDFLASGSSPETQEHTVQAASVAMDARSELERRLATARLRAEGLTAQTSPKAREGPLTSDGVFKRRR